MGANQSQDETGSSCQGNASSVCYYQLLDVAQNASDEEIKKAYRRKALELHPDRNLNDIENATKQFADVQVAYEVLSDPQERAWYDSHRDIILDGDDNSAHVYESNVRVTTSNDVLLMIRKLSGHVHFSDSSDGFFGALGEFFARLAQQEEIVCQSEGIRSLVYPSFGLADDPYAEKARIFYSQWANFATNKSFAWKDMYRLSDAPDRRVRRLMEKENKRLRDDAVREFNDAVRSLVAFARKRDPRVPITTASELDRQKILKDAAISQATRSKLANHAKIRPMETMPEWMRTDGPNDDVFAETKESAPQAVIECIVCRKVFKSEKQFQVHEKSKKHVKVVKQIQREMRQDSAYLDLQKADSSDDSSEMPVGADVDEISDPSSQRLPSKGNDRWQDTVDLSASDDDSLSSSSASSRRDLADDIEELELHDKTHLAHVTVSQDSPLPDAHATIEDDRAAKATELDGETRGVEKPGPKIGKAKIKRAKKAAQRSNSAEVGSSEHQCLTCQSSFPSKTRLFTHIKDFGHAQVSTKSTKVKRRAKS